jgi:hypothetical protein
MNIRRFFIGLGLALLIILALIPLIASIAAEYIIDDQLALRGASNVSVDEIWINPYTGIVDIKDLKFSVAEAEYGLDLLQLTVSLEELLDSRVWVKTIAIKGLDISVRQNETGDFLINGLDISSQAEETQVVDEKVAAEHNTVVWNYALDFLAIDDVRIDIVLPEVNVLAQLDSLVVKDIDTGIEKSATIEMIVDVKKVQLPDADLAATVNINYKTDLEFQGVLQGKPKINAKSILAVSGLEVDSQGFSIVVPTAKFNIQTAVDYDNDLAYQVSLSAALKQLMLRHVATNKPVAQFDELLLDSTLSPREINIKSLAINDFQAFTQSADVNPDLLNNIDLNVSEVTIALTPEQSLKSIDVQQVELASAVIRLLIDKQGEMPQLAMIESFLVANNAETQIASGEALELSAPLEETIDNTAADSIPITVQKIVIQPDVIVYFVDKVFGQYLVKRLE